MIPLPILLTDRIIFVISIRNFNDNKKMRQYYNNKQAQHACFVQLKYQMTVERKRFKGTQVYILPAHMCKFFKM